jgi:hypothetical protein
MNHVHLSEGHFLSKERKMNIRKVFEKASMGLMSSIYKKARAVLETSLNAD